MDTIYSHGSEEVRLSDLGAQQAGIEITPTPEGLRSEPVKVEFQVERREDNTYVVPDHVGDTVKIVEGQPNAARVAETFLRQQAEGQSLDAVIEDAQQTDAAADWTQNQINTLQEEMRELQVFNKKLLLALKHMGFDTNKHFR